MTPQKTSHPPPPAGLVDGGRWRTIKPASGRIFGFCCPSDEKDVYVLNRNVFDHNGEYMGHVARFDFRPHRTDNMMATARRNERGIFAYKTAPLAS